MITEAQARSSNDHLELDRVRRHTAAGARQRIDAKTRAQIRTLAMAPRDRLDSAIAELDRERDMEQVLETNASLLALSGALLGTTVHRGFFALTGVVLTFLTQHATSGWCPPVPIFRAVGVRTRSEIDQEKYALKALRGDFQHVRDANGAIQVDRLIEALNR